MMRFCVIFTLIVLCQCVIAVRQCTSPGKFQSDLSSSCDGYTMCLTASGGTFARYNLSCPAGFIYNHIQNQCTNDTNYQCVPDFNCTAIGLFVNPFSVDCTSYIACVEGATDIITARSVKCPADQIFSPIESACATETIFKCNRNKRLSEIVNAAVVPVEQAVIPVDQAVIPVDQAVIPVDQAVDVPAAPAVDQPTGTLPVSPSTSNDSTVNQLCFAFLAAILFTAALI